MKGNGRSRRSGLLSQYTFDVGQCVSRKRGEKALRAAAVEQAMASRAKSEFLANMSHELRTPLNAIIGFSDLIGCQGGLPQAKSTEYALLINHAGKHLLNIITDILDVSKIESGTFELDRDMHPLRELITSAVSLVEARIVEKHQTLNVALPGTLPLVYADARRVRQIVINLLSNAHKFTPEGGRITLAAAADPGAVTVSVRDTGVGMSPEQIMIALKPFGQVNASRSRQHEGTGLGLPIAKALAEQHRGALWVDSTEGHGTTVSFTLPTGNKEKSS
jgi:two-component system, cell cycle sensor histidine kinase PleC